MLPLNAIVYETINWELVGLTINNERIHSLKLILNTIVKLAVILNLSMMFPNIIIN